MRKVILYGNVLIRILENLKLCAHSDGVRELWWWRGGVDVVFRIIIWVLWGVDAMRGLDCRWFC